MLNAYLPSSNPYLPWLLEAYLPTSAPFLRRMLNAYLPSSNPYLPWTSSNLPWLLEAYLPTSAPFLRRMLNAYLPSSMDSLQTSLLKFRRVRPFTADELALILKRNRNWIKNSYLPPLIRDGILEYSLPDYPNHPDQAYRTRNRTS